MKRILALLPLLLCLISAHAQDTENPYTFKGIPIEGTTDNFIKQLVKQGFTVEKNDYSLDNFSEQCLYGTFFNRDVMILLSENRPNSINAVYVFFNTDDLDSTISVFKDVRTGLNTKYGNSEDYVFIDTKSIEDKSLLEIKHELLVNGETYSSGVVLKNQDTTLPHITLVLSKDITTLTYLNLQNFNPNNYYNDL